MKKVILFLLAAALLFAACNSDKKDESSDKKETMSPGNKDAMTSAAEKNRQTALTAVQVVNALDLNAAFKNGTPDAVDYNDGSMPPVKNIDSIKAGIKAWMAAFPDVKENNIA